MQAKDHRMLAETLLAASELKISYFCKRCFLRGNTLPDRNPATYLRRVEGGPKYRGHNYVNTKPLIEKLFSTLQGREKFGPHEFFLLGKLSHYVADAFTYPHNEIFKGTIREHCRYEEELHLQMQQILKNPELPTSFHFREMDINVIESVHRDYIKVANGCQTDCRYIIPAVEYLLGLVTETQNVTVMVKEKTQLVQGKTQEVILETQEILQAFPQILPTYLFTNTESNSRMQTSA